MKYALESNIFYVYNLPQNEMVSKTITNTLFRCIVRVYVYWFMCKYLLKSQLNVINTQRSTAERLLTSLYVILTETHTTWLGKAALLNKQKKSFLPEYI